MKKYIVAVALLAMALFALDWLGVPASITGRTVQLFASTPSVLSVETTIQPIVLFCPRDQCKENLLELFRKATTIDCAFFDLDIPELVTALNEKNARLVIDGNNENDAITNVVYDTSSQYTHNKFCIFNNNTIVTGSYNPTVHGDEKNNNNLIIINSRLLAANYQDEFDELWNREFGKGKPVLQPVIILNGKRIENYFCPEDHCADHVIRTLDTANTSIFFMAFSFTHDGIGDALLRAAQRDVAIHGVMEKSQNNQYHELPRLQEAGLDVQWDTNPYLMHHKVFIIDEKIAITGSFNPSKNADEKNDENVLIVHDEKIAEQFIVEFEMLAP